MSDERLRPWQVLSTTYRIDTPFLRLRADRVALPDGAVVDEYFVRESAGFTIVFALTPDERVVLVRQYKHGVAECVTELPAGGMERGEAPAACAARELAEETGYTGSTPEPVRTLLTDPTSSDSRFHVFVVRDARRTHEPQLDVTEEIDVFLAAIDDVRAMAYDGRIAAGSQVAAALLALAYLGRSAG